MFDYFYDIPYVRSNNNFDYCNLCNRPVHNITKALTCVYCKCLTHISCTRLSDTDCLAVQCCISDWTCVRCVEEIFPFGKIDDDLEYLEYMILNILVLCLYVHMALNSHIYLHICLYIHMALKLLDSP